MAEEDLIFGQNRHMFGGIEPSNTLEIQALPVNGHIQITVELPKDTIIDGQLLCAVGGAVIRRKTDGYPEDEFDGDFVADITKSGAVMDTTANPDAPYYYAVFPYSTQGVYNRNHENRHRYNFSGASYYYGFDIDLDDPDPATRVTYPRDVMNSKFEPAAMGSGPFDYGGWPSTPGEKFMPRPCVLNLDGTVKYYLDPDDYNKSIDGDDIDIYDSTTNVMMEWPKIYTHREVVNGVYKFRCSDVKVGNDWDCWCNYDSNNNVIDHFYTGVFKGKLSGDRLASLPGKAYFGGGSSSANKVYYTDMISLAKANGTGWNVSLLCDFLLIEDLLIMIGKTTNLDSMWKGTIDGSNNEYDLNYGSVSGTSVYHESYNEGRCGKGGLFYTEYKNQRTNVACYTQRTFGMEYYLEGMVLNGLVLSENNIKVKLTSGTHDGSSTTDYNATGVGYVQIGTFSGSYGGYIKTNQIEQFGRIPIDFGGSSTTYDATYFAWKVIDDASGIRFGQYFTSDNAGDSFIATWRNAVPFLSYKRPAL